MRWRTVVGCMLAVGTAACVDDSVATIEPAVTTTAAPMGDAADLLEVGEGARTGHGNTITLLEVGIDGDVQRPAVHVEVCIGAEADDAVRVGPLDFVLGTDANRAVDPDAPDVLQPFIRIYDVAAGECVRGWVAFELGDGETAAQLATRTDPPLRWDLGVT